MKVERPHIAVFGAGRTGREIALAFAHGGYDVRIVDAEVRAADQFARFAGDVRAALRAALATFAINAVDRIDARVQVIPATDTIEAIAQADVVFEAVADTLEAKRIALVRIGACAQPGATIASTTASQLATDLAGFVPRPERFLAIRWPDPAYLMPIVELSPHPATSRHALSWLRAILEDIGNVPVECAPAPGGIVDRLRSLVANETARMVEEGIATQEAVERAARLGLGLHLLAGGPDDTPARTLALVRHLGLDREPR
jgi:3-hydroxybutyryl-CoA dehydrogenase